MTRRLRRYAAFTAMTGLLFVQSCLAMSTCALTPAPSAPAALAHADCPFPGSVPKADPLCQVNCQTALSVPSTPAPEAAPPLAAPVLVVAALDVPADVVDRRPSRIPMATAPPIAIRYCRFQI